MRALRISAAALTMALMLVPAATASAAKTPRVTSVSPMKVRAGGTLVIKGSGFIEQRVKDTVILRSPDGRALFVKPRRASTRRLVITVPTAIERFLERDGAGRLKATRFRLKVLAGRFGRLTPRARSPLVLPRAAEGRGGAGVGPGPGAGAPEGDCDADGVGNSGEADDDGDLLPDAREGTLKTDSCKRDTDGDGVEDGYEVEAALP